MKMKWICVGLFGWIMIILLSCTEATQKRVDANSAKRDTAIQPVDELNRNPAQFHYSKHARCRMDCRHIDEAEIKDILQNGTINYHKSELNADACHQKYAVEGYAKDQHLRIIFAPCGVVMTVVTCIDLANEWECHCPGDH